MKYATPLFSSKSFGLAVCAGLMFSPLAMAKADDHVRLDTRKGGGQNVAGHAGLLVESDRASRGGSDRAESDVRKGGGQNVAGHGGLMSEGEGQRQGSDSSDSTGLAGRNNQIDQNESATEDVAVIMGEQTACGKIIIYKTEHAVGDPCMDSRDFMQSLGFTDSQIKNVIAQVESVGRAVAH